MVFKESLWGVARIRKGHDGILVTLQEERDQRDTLPRVALVCAGQLEKRPIWAHSFRGSSLWSNYQRLGVFPAGSTVFRPLAKQGDDG